MHRHPLSENPNRQRKSAYIRLRCQAIHGAMPRLLRPRPNVPKRSLELDLTSSRCPIKQGLCGTPAPILLRSLGRDAEVEIDPPATVSCELAKALSDWVDDLQRYAEALLGSTVVKLRASSYVCRNVYNRADPPLSQHALANALDLSEFVLASGEHITVREDWNQRFANAELPLRNPIHLTNASGSLQTVVAYLQGKSAFIQSAHEDACRIFGTVLGPRANRAHHDHFHLDIKERRASFCR